MIWKKKKEKQTPFPYPEESYIVFSGFQNLDTSVAILSSSTLTAEHIFMAVLLVFICAKHCVNAHQKGMGRRVSFIFGLNVIIKPSKMALLV